MCLFPQEGGLVIAFDTLFLAKRFRNVGTYEYARSLLWEFHKLAGQNSDVVIRYFQDKKYSDEVGATALPGCEPINTRLLRFHRLWRLGLINTAAHRAGADMIFTPSPNVLTVGALPVAVTIHDAMPERLPAELIDKGLRLRIHFRRSAKLAYKILTDSEHSRKDLIDIYDLPTEKVSVAYLGYDRERFNSSPVDPRLQQSLLTSLGIRTPYILHHGMVQLRKNLGRLIKAYDILLNRRRINDLQLVLAGPFGKGADKVRKVASALSVNRNIIFTGTLDARDLAVLIKGATLCVIPSLYEGFCLPMVEAMACGVPTIVANSSCLPEVSGGVLRYFDPLSEEDMAATIEDVLDHSELQDDLVKHGLQRASEFSWRRCAEETLMALTSSTPALVSASVA